MTRSAVIVGALLMGYGLITIVVQISGRRQRRSSRIGQYLYGALLTAAGLILLLANAGALKR